MNESHGTTVSTTVTKKHPKFKKRPKKRSVHKIRAPHSQKKMRSSLTHDMYLQCVVRYHNRIPLLVWRCMNQFFIVPPELISLGVCESALPLARVTDTIHPLLYAQGFRPTLMEFYMLQQSTNTYPVSEFYHADSEEKWKIMLDSVRMCGLLELPDVADYFSRKLAEQIVLDFINTELRYFFYTIRYERARGIGPQPYEFSNSST